MPLYEYQCLDCGREAEILVTGTSETPCCPACAGTNLKRLLSAHAAVPGSAQGRMPGPGDTTCCGSSPGHGSCAGPGSCCGKA